MLAESWRKENPTLNLGHLLAKDESAQFVSQLLYLFGIFGVAEALCKFKEILLLLLPSFQTQFQQFEQHSVAAESAVLGNCLNLPVDLLGKGDASSNLLR
jgi:hypothetical protein